MMYDDYDDKGMVLDVLLTVAVICLFILDIGLMILWN